MTHVDYHEYIATDAWREKRTAALERSVRGARSAGCRWPTPRCEVCGRAGTHHKSSRSSLDPRERRFRVEGSNGLHVHHIHYRRLGNETPADLIVLCTDVLVWVASGYHNYAKRVGCHERVHDDPVFRGDVERQARERGYA